MESPRSETEVPAKKLVVSTYLQYILIAVGVFLLVVFVRQLSGVLLTFLMAAVLAYALNPLVRRLEQLRSEEHTSELQSRQYLVCRLLLEKKKKYRLISYA